MSSLVGVVRKAIVSKAPGALTAEGAGLRLLRGEISMPQLFIRITNGKFHSCDDGGEYADPAAALAFGIEGAVGIAAEEVVRGECNAAVVISVEQEDGKRLLCSVVAVSVSPLLSATEPFRRLSM